MKLLFYPQMNTDKLKFLFVFISVSVSRLSVDNFLTEP